MTATKKPIKDIPFHPLSEEYPLMPAFDLGRLEEGMRGRGYDQRFPIVLYKKQILDGRNRFLAAKEAGVKPTFVTFEGTEEEARFFVQVANEERRHLAPEWLRQRREERLKRVFEARAAGESTRAIAEAEGISQTQVIRDLGTTLSGEPPGSVEPASGTVKGLDGKTRSASKPPPTPSVNGHPAKPPTPAKSSFCERCTRAGPIRDCKYCAELKAGVKQREAGDDTDAIEEDKRKQKALPKNGKEIPRWKDAEPHIGALVRFLDDIARPFKANNSPEAQAFRDRLGKWKEDVEAWAKALVKGA